MYKETLRAIAGIGLFPALSLVLFFSVFSLMLLRVFGMNRDVTEHLAGLPLESSDGLPPARPEANR